MNDRYLKGVLTVIAVALVWIAVQLTTGNAYAIDASQDVRIHGAMEKVGRDAKGKDVWAVRTCTGTPCQ